MYTHSVYMQLMIVCWMHQLDAPVGCTSWMHQLVIEVLIQKEN